MKNKRKPELRGKSKKTNLRKTKKSMKKKTTRRGRRVQAGGMNEDTVEQTENSLIEAIKYECQRESIVIMTNDDFREISTEKLTRDAISDNYLQKLEVIPLIGKGEYIYLSKKIIEKLKIKIREYLTKKGIQTITDEKMMSFKNKLLEHFKKNPETFLKAEESKDTDRKFYLVDDRRFSSRVCRDNSKDYNNHNELREAIYQELYKPSFLPLSKTSLRYHNNTINKST